MIRLKAAAWIAMALLGLLAATGCSSPGNRKNEVAGEKPNQTQGASANYGLRVLVVDAQGGPIENAKVTSSLGGEPQKIPGGWQFDIPSASVPSNGNVTVYATVENPALKGETEIQLAADHNPTATVRVTPVKQK